MKAKYLFIAACLLLCISACKKDITSNVLNGSIVGKWFVNKLTIQQKTINGSTVADTTYTGTAFNTHDYFQFNSDSTASVSSSGIFNVSGKGTATDGTGTPVYGTNQYKYSISGSLLILTSTFLHPTPCCGATGPDTETIIQLDANNLVLQDMANTGTYIITTDTYYTRGN
jgi:hypothetical protein